MTINILASRKSTTSWARKIWAPLAAAALAAGALAAVTPAPAHADALPDNLAKYQNCPIGNPDVEVCVYVKSTNTHMKLGDFDLTSTDPITLEFGLKFDPVTFAAIVVPPTDLGSIMTAGPIEVPGGITGIPGGGVGPLAAYATPELTALPEVNLTNLRSGRGPAFHLELRARIDNPFTDFLTMLGTKCHVGSASDPIAMDLTTGTTDPPPPNTPISGTYNPATNAGQPIGGFKFPDEKTVDNAFRAPGAHDCGLTGALNPIINAQGGLPAAAGTNTAELTSDIYTAGADTVRDALTAPGNNVVDGDFEAAGMGPWVCAEQCGVDHGLGNAHSGDNNGWVRNNNNEWNDIHQTVSVAPNTDYTLTGWVRTSSNNTDGYFGVRKLDGTVVSEQKYGNLPGYTQETVHLNTGDSTKLVVYGGVWAVHGDTWAQLDDISLSAD